MIEQSFTAYMAAAPELVALRAERFNFLNLDLDGPMPAQTWYTTGAPQDPNLDGDSYQRLRIQIDHWAKDAYAALTLREATRVLLNAVENLQLSDGTVLLFCEYIGPLDFYDNDEEAFRCASEWYLHFNFTA